MKKKNQTPFAPHRNILPEHFWHLGKFGILYKSIITITIKNSKYLHRYTNFQGITDASDINNQNI